MATPYELTKDGIESQFQVNHLSHFVLITALAELMEKTGAVSLTFCFFSSSLLKSIDY